LIPFARNEDIAVPTRYPREQMHRIKYTKLTPRLNTETEIGPDCTLVEMARQQGSGVVRSSESAVLENTYRRDGGWKILTSTRRT
jgi:hypothetical protein